MLLVAAAATGPLYERAVEQAAVRSVLRGSDVVGRGLQVVPDDKVDPADITVPGHAAALFDPPIAGTDVPVQFVTARYPRLAGTLTTRARQCTELVLTTGTCPTLPNQVVASASLATAVGLRVGQVVTTKVPTLVGNASFTEKVLVVGLYRPFSSEGTY